MIITCSNCRASYSVEADAIGSKGRTIKCSSCSHSWFEKAQDDAKPVELEALEKRKAGHLVQGWHHIDLGQDSGGPSAVPLSVTIPAPAEKAAKRSRPSFVAPALYLTKWATIATGMVAGATLATKYVPPMLVPPQPPSVEVEIASGGPTISVLQETMRADQTPERFAVEARIENTGAYVINVGKIHAALTDNIGTPIKQWRINLPFSSLEAGESRTVTLYGPMPADGAENLQMSFLR